MLSLTYGVQNVGDSIPILWRFHVQASERRNVGVVDNLLALGNSDEFFVDGLFSCTASRTVPLQASGRVENLPSGERSWLIG